MAVIKAFEDFVRVHGYLLAASGIPTSLYPDLFLKLSTETFDGGDFFRIEECEDGRQRRLVLSAESLQKESGLFLIDHAWSFRLRDARKQLEEIPGLANRMATLMCVLDGSPVLEDSGCEGEKIVEDTSGKSPMKIVEKEMRKAKEEGRVVYWLDLEEMDIDDDMLHSLDISSKFPDLIGLNLWGNKIQHIETIVREFSNCRDLRAIWLNENPACQKWCSSGSSLADELLKSLPNLEICNSQFTSKYSSWALGFAGGKYGVENPCCDNTVQALNDITNLDLSNRFIHSLLNKEFCPRMLPSLVHLNIRGNPLDHDLIDDLFKLLRSFSGLQILEVDVPGPLGDNAIDIVKSLPTICILNGVHTSKIAESCKEIVDSMLLPHLPEWSTDDLIIDRVISAMWLYAMTYRLADEEKIDETPVWYIMDELGSALRHSDEPNFRVAPFLYMPEGNLQSAVSFSVLWPIQTINKGDECVRDFLYGISEDKQRSARLTAWFHTPEEYFIMKYKRYCQQLQSATVQPPDLHGPEVIWAPPADGCPLRVYTDIPQVEKYLTRKEFVLTNDIQDADIAWASFQIDQEVREALGIEDSKYINQFPFEACLVMKHHLAETVRKVHGSPDWLQPTYNLETQLAEFIGDYLTRKRNSHDNLWILKPWNMARTIDTTVTGDLIAIIRHIETGPKICQKYIEAPALFRGKKFDLRYIVLACSIKPLDLFLSDVFWVRMANNNYTVDKRSFFEYETHFTVMNYIGKLNHIHTPEFVAEFEKEHQVRWLDIHQRISNMIRDVFVSAATSHPEMQSPFSRAIYGVDVMLDCNFKPKLLEVTYCPDCTRACKYDTAAILGDGETIKAKDFFNDVFGCLFLGETTHCRKI